MTIELQKYKTHAEWAKRNFSLLYCYLNQPLFEKGTVLNPRRFAYLYNYWRITYHYYNIRGMENSYEAEAYTKPKDD
jgi:hypothetical protein